MQLKAYMYLNSRMIFKDKITFFWSFILPVFMLIVNVDFESKEAIPLEFITAWWIYMIINGYLFGVGIQAVQMREVGSLKTTFSIKWTPVIYFFSNVLTQMIYVFVLLMLFNVVCSFFVTESLLILVLYSLKTIIYLLPIAFLGFLITKIRKGNVSNLNTVVSGAILIVFVLQGTSKTLDKINPYIWLNHMVLSSDLKENSIYLMVGIVCVALCLPSIVHFSPLPNERR
ncbi:hypothetical protein JNUCC83_11560 [Vagococcus sp. JNUCC 83]